MNLDYLELISILITAVIVIRYWWVDVRNKHDNRKSENDRVDTVERDIKDIIDTHKLKCDILEPQAENGEKAYKWHTLMKDIKDWCTCFPEKWRGVNISECCKLHDETLSTSKFYYCLKSKIGRFHALYITVGGAIGAWVKYPKKMIRKV